MEAIRAKALETENRVRTLETEGLQLQMQQQLLSQLSTQSTLLLGFALATYGADLLPYVLDSSSQFCLYKTMAHLIIGAIFLTTSTCTVGFCLLVTIFTSLLITRSQEAYLHVGGQAAVFRMNVFIQKIFYWHAFSIGSFLLAAILLMWIFLGLPGYVEATNGAGGDYDYLSNEGKYLTSCLDLTDQSQHDMRDNYGLAVTIANTVLFCAFIGYFYVQYEFMIRTFAIDKIRGEELVRKEQEAWKNKLASRNAITVAKYQLKAASRELTIARKEAKDIKEMERLHREVISWTKQLGKARSGLRVQKDKQRARAVVNTVLRRSASPAQRSDTGALLTRMRVAAKRVIWSNARDDGTEESPYGTGSMPVSQQQCTSGTSGSTKLSTPWRVKTGPSGVTTLRKVSLQGVGVATDLDDDQDSTA
uniref:Uncharacterized protein n=1 Tax=Haptolina brevifila TaxID=156173 RepID=A0A7S2BLV1_9EUKA|eukprot:CAMPEP_0174732350 /NCGR_PEP_ID=MMETSP1094-20130205/59250_1 /TAXON_ID=156173 /ORGANISM="Chrysochromulina brevifilum, Strain UTEX LB 985" /LENGTH=419 /DNA_ID=CAMNT_0015934855 /DNA_START=42 /DNA_END=1301 /DNA_ORIENTATION=+